jgi:P4 family phage/plasmid primase-like protien
MTIPTLNIEEIATQENLPQVSRSSRTQACRPSMPTPLQVPSLYACDARNGTQDSHPLTEKGNANRMFDLHGPGLRYIHDNRSWLTWKGGRWTWDTDGATVLTLALNLSSAIYNEGNNHPSDAILFAKWGHKSESRHVASAAVKILSYSAHIRLESTSLDANGFLVGLDKGRQVVDLRSGIVRNAVQSDYITKSMKVERLGDKAKATQWLRFLEQIFDSDKSLIDWIHRFCGYVLTGSTCEQILLFCYGNGANGKSVFIELLKYVLGDYACVIAPETLADAKRRAGSATPELANLIGKRLAMCSETEENTGLAESFVKSLISGDSMPVRQLYAQQSQFTPTCKLIMAGNHKPVVRGNDNGIWRRIRLVPFNKTFTKKEKDPFLLDKLKEEAPHILAWMIDGCIKWQKEGLANIPLVIDQATNEYRNDQDIVNRWLGECTDRKADHEETTKDLYASYRAWCDANGMPPVSSTVFGRRLREKGFTWRKSNSNNYWRGVELLSPACSPV